MDQHLNLPFFFLGCDHLRDVFYAMGLSDQDIVALSGAHTLVCFICETFCLYLSIIQFNILIKKNFFYLIPRFQNVTHLVIKF